MQADEELAGAVTVIDGAADVAKKYPRALGRQPLNSVGQIREEVCRLYRAVTQGKLSAKEAARAVYILQVAAKMVEVEKIEPMLEAIQREREARRGR